MSNPERRATCVIALLALFGASCSHTSHNVSQPFVSSGGIEAGLSSGLWGDTGSGPAGLNLGCMPRRHFALAIALHNRSRQRVTVTGVTGVEPAPGIIRRVAVQVRLAPVPRNREMFTSSLREWSDAPLMSVAIPPGRDATVQSNFLMGDCVALDLHGTLTTNEAITVRYRAGNRDGDQRIAQGSARILLSRGPTIRECAVPRDTHVLKLRTLDLACGVARRLSVACRRITRGRSGTRCGFASRRWDCNWIPRPRSRVVESCFANTSSIRAVWSR